MVEGNKGVVVAKDKVGSGGRGGFLENYGVSLLLLGVAASPIIAAAVAPEAVTAAAVVLLAVGVAEYLGTSQQEVA